MLFTVIKRDGRVENFKPEKIERAVDICAEGLVIDKQKFLEKLSLNLRPNMRTSDIQRALITTAINVLAGETKNITDWSIFAARLILMDFRKRIRIKRQKEYPESRFNITGHFVSFKDFWKSHLKKYIDLGIYSPLYEEIPYRVARELYNDIFINSWEDKLWNGKVKHFQIQKFINSYLINYNNEPIETPEEVWFLQSLIVFLPSVVKFKEYDWELYKEKVKQHYNYLSEFMIVPATPQMLNLRTARPNLSSCFILDVNDNTESISHTQTQISQISRNAGGVGLFLGKLRPSKSWIRGNYGLANSIQEWVKLFETTIYNYNQQGKRKGAITMALPIWHKDIFDFLQSIDTDIGNPARKSPEFFPQVVIPDFFFDYLNKKEDFYLIDRHEIVDILGREDLDLIDVYGDEARARYQKIVELIKQGKVKNYKKVKPQEILTKIFYYWNRKGLPYIFFEDNANKYSPFTEKIYSANLCVESFSPFRNTNPKDVYCIKDEEIGYIHTCNITNVNLFKLYEKGYLPLFENEYADGRALEKLEKFVEHLYEYMDNLLELQQLPVKESKKHNELFRTVTAGFLGLADVFVQYTINKGKYVGYRYYTRRADKSETLKVIDKIFGTFSLLAQLVTSRLAKTRGRAPKYAETKLFKEGKILGRYKYKEEDKNLIISLIGENRYKELVENIESYGVRNTLLLNCPPNTSTSILAGVSAGVVPTYNLIQIEDQKSGLFVSFVPLYDRAPLYYDTYSNFQNYDDYKSLIEVISQIQKWIDSGISFEITVNHTYFDAPDKLTKLYALIIREARRNGIKAIYYLRHILKDKTVDGSSSCEACAN